MATIDEAQATAVTRLTAAGIPDARLDARVLIMAATGLSREALLAHGTDVIGADAATRFDGYVSRREKGEPVARILGHKEFWSLDFEVTADTLIPRPETETVVEAALACASDRDAALNVLDLGTGTGCLLLAFLSERPNARGVCIDINPGAVTVAARNADRLGLAGRAQFLVADFAGELPLSAGQRFDVILSNPPYIPDGEIAGLAPDVACYEPRLALSGGADGFVAYRTLAGRLAQWLAPGGSAFLEIGQGQADGIARIMADAGLTVLARHADLAGITRVLTVSPA
jgi:release factor glutamine methyltransferase